MADTVDMLLCIQPYLQALTNGLEDDNCALMLHMAMSGGNNGTCDLFIRTNEADTQKPGKTQNVTSAQSVCPKISRQQRNCWHPRAEYI